MTNGYVSYYGQADDAAPGGYDQNELMTVGVYVPAGAYDATGTGYGYGTYDYEDAGYYPYGYYDTASPGASLYVSFAGYGYESYASGAYSGYNGYGGYYGYGSYGAYEGGYPT